MQRIQIRLSRHPAAAISAAVAAFNAATSAFTSAIDVAKMLISCCKFTSNHTKLKNRFTGPIVSCPKERSGVPRDRMCGTQIPPRREF